MFAPSELSPRLRNLVAGLIQRTWGWVSAVGMVSPDDAAGRRFRAMGRASGIAFPPGAVYGEQWISIGSETMIGPNVSLAVGIPGEPIDDERPPVIAIGDRCNVGRGTSIIGRCAITIDDDVTIGPNVYITDHNHAYDDVGVPIGRQFPIGDAVHIGAGSWLATGVIVLPGARIGRNVAVAAGSVVRGEIPDHAVIAGAPARVVRRYYADAGWDPPRDAPPPPPEGWTTD
ncbi:MAG: acyltransferase [Actinobacteria bacterium]|nr:acyltransferase [Actinomycetota bacterium]